METTIHCKTLEFLVSEILKGSRKDSGAFMAGSIARIREYYTFRVSGEIIQFLLNCSFRFNWHGKTTRVLLWKKIVFPLEFYVYRSNFSVVKMNLFPRKKKREAAPLYCKEFNECVFWFFLLVLVLFFVDARKLLCALFSPKSGVLSPVSFTFYFFLSLSGFLTFIFILFLVEEDL